MTDAPSTPVPFDGSVEVALDASLMFLGGRDAVSHKVFMAKKGEPVVLLATLAGTDNIVTPTALVTWPIMGANIALPILV